MTTVGGIIPLPTTYTVTVGSSAQQGGGVTLPAGSVARVVTVTGSQLQSYRGRSDYAFLDDTLYPVDVVNPVQVRAVTANQPYSTSRLLFKATNLPATLPPALGNLGDSGFIVQNNPVHLIDRNAQVLSIATYSLRWSLEATADPSLASLCLNRSIDAAGSANAPAASLFFVQGERRTCWVIDRSGTASKVGIDAYNGGGYTGLTAIQQWLRATRTATYDMVATALGAAPANTPDDCVRFAVASTPGQTSTLVTFRLTRFSCALGPTDPNGQEVFRYRFSYVLAPSGEMVVEQQDPDTFAQLARNTIQPDAQIASFVQRDPANPVTPSVYSPGSGVSLDEQEPTLPFGNNKWSFGLGDYGVQVRIGQIEYVP